MLRAIYREVAVSVHEQNALDFAHKYSGWHSYAQDPLTRKVINSLARKGLVLVNKYQQFALA